MDDSFGPRLLGHFDFTLLFEHAILHIIPSAIALFTVPFYIHKIIKARRIVQPGWLLWSKFLVAFSIAAIQLAILVFWYNSPLNSKIAQAAAILTFASSVGLIVITYASHAHFLQPVLFLALYLTTTLLFDLVTIRTYLSRNGLGTVAYITCTLPPLKAALIVLEEVSKRSLIIPEQVRNSLGDEVIAGFWNKSTFIWVNPLLLFGFRHVIDNDSLPDIGHQFNSEKLYRNFKRSWDKRDQKATHALLKACVYSMPWPFVYIVLPRLLQVGFIFSQPFLLQDVVNVVSQEPVEQGDISRSDEITGLILATALVFVGKAISRNWFSHIRNQIMICMRGMLITAIYRKSLKLSALDSGESPAITLMTADVSGIERLISLSYDSWAMVLQVGLGIAVLAIFVGTASMFTVITAIVVTVCSRLAAKHMGQTRRRWNEHIEDRVGATSNILAQIKDIKMIGLAPSMTTHLQKLHDKEVEVSLTDRRVVSITFGISAFTETVTPALVVAATLFWTRDSETMSSARFYTILAVVTLVAEPLAAFLGSLPQWSAGFACLDRIQKYLAQDEPKDTRRFLEAPVVEPGTASDAPGLRHRGPPQTPNQFAVKIENINVTMDLTGSILRNVTMYVRSGEITMIDGSVGCGKSTLLNVILGEMMFRSGTVTLSSLSISYAGQKPWLLNTTIRLNIIGHKAYDHVLYERIIFICDLQIDLDQLPEGDETMVGSGGGLLSGGQKQRISIARALYDEADITILDDPFSSLDRETSALIRIRLISDGNATPGGRTLIMTTSMKQHLVDADTVFRVSNQGQVTYVTPARIDEELNDLVRNHGSGNMPTVQGAATANEKYEPPHVQQSSVTAAKLIPDQNLSHGGFSMYAYFLRPAGVVRVTIWLVLVILASVSEKLPNIFVRIWLDHGLADHRYYIGYAILCLAYPVMNSVSAIVFFYKVNAKSASGLHKTLTEATFKATFQFLMDEDAGSLLNRFSQDISMATQRVPALILPTVFRGISVLIDVGIISAGARYAAPVIPFFLLLVVGIQQYYLRTSRQLRVLELDTSKTLMRHVTETASGIEHIRAFQWQEKLIQEFHSIFDITQRPLYFLYCVQQWLEGVLDFASAAAAVVVVSFAVEFPSSASANSMGLALLSLISFSDTVSTWIKSSVAMETAFGAVSRVRTYSANTPLEEFKDTAPVPPDWPTAGRLELNSVTAVYKSSGAAPALSPLRNVTAIIQPGETLGLVGRTGSGKTTILLSILNLLEYSGTISIDDREIRTVPPDLLRSRLTIITQGRIHLKATVRFNLDPFDPASRPPSAIVTDEMQMDVLRRVGLWDIISRRGSLDAPMKTMNFSQGQAQLFQLARAILHHEVTGSRIVLMDEGTAGLDEETESRITEVLAEAFDKCTKLFISHRMPTLEGSESVMVLDGTNAHVLRHTPNQTDWRHGL